MRGGAGGGAPRTPKKLQKFEKISFKKLPKCIVFAYFTQNFTNPALVSLVLDEKHKFLKILRKFSNIFLRKLLKMNYFCLFYIKFYKPCVKIFARSDEKHKLLEIMRKF